MNPRSKRLILLIVIILCAVSVVLVINIFGRTSGDTNKILMTIPEGLAASDMARFIKQDIPLFESGQFALEAKPYEGYLLPGTYLFSPTTTSQEVLDVMLKNFDTKTKWIRFFSTLNRKSFEDVLIVASLVEEESSRDEDRRIIAGIIWKRLSLNMPLQLDAPFFYLLGKASHELTYADLAMDSPYNLYKNKGLPPRPIDNPSLRSMRVALYPLETNYLYFLSDSNGIMHFSETFEEHMQKRRSYIE